MTTTIKLHDLNEAIRYAIRRLGEDYVYPQIEGSCFYRQDVEIDEHRRIIGASGPAGCLVGQAFDKLGVLPEEMGYRSFWEPGDGPMEGAAASQLSEALELRIMHKGEDVTHEVGVALNYLQGKQDAGDDWGQAYSEWLAELERTVPNAWAEFRESWINR